MPEPTAPTTQPGSPAAAQSNTAAACAAQAAASEDAETRLARAQAIISKNVLWALGAGVVPLPIVDIAAVATVNLKMLRELSACYGVTFSEGLTKKIIYSLLSSVGVLAVGSVVGGSLAKLLPGIGTTLGFLSVPVIAAAFAHSLGRVLVMHFEAGGTLLDFDPNAMRSYFKQEFEKAKVTVTQMQKDKQQSSSSGKVA